MIVSPLPNAPRPWWHLSLTRQIFLGLIIGGLIGYLAPEFGTSLSWLRDIFLHLIKAIIAPLVFATVVVGIAGGGSAKNVGTLGLKSLLYFEVVTTIALVLGLLVVNIVQPGAGVVLQGNDGILSGVAQAHPKTLIETLVHVAPESIIQSMARGDVLQIVVFAAIFGFALGAIGEKGRPVLEWCESLASVMFRFTSIVMYLAPIGVGAAMAATIGHQGLDVLFYLGKLILSLYAALAVFVVVVLGLIMRIARIPLRPFLRVVREPMTIAFVTTSSESALPKAMENLEAFGVPKRIVGFVMPTGYSFNLDGTTLYLSMAAVFLAQAVATTVPGFTFGLEQQLTMMLTLMITSKGVAAVPRASLVILLACVNQFLPAPYGAIGVAMIFGIDEVMDMARSAVNLLGNCLATAVMARWEGALDDEAVARFGEAPAEA